MTEEQKEKGLDRLRKWTSEHKGILTDKRRLYRLAYYQKNSVRLRKYRCEHASHATKEQIETNLKRRRERYLKDKAQGQTRYFKNKEMLSERAKQIRKQKRKVFLEYVRNNINLIMLIYGELRRRRKEKAKQKLKVFCSTPDYHARARAWAKVNSQRPGIREKAYDYKRKWALDHKRVPTEEQRERWRARSRKRHLTITDEQREENREYQRKWWLKKKLALTEEEKEKRREYNRKFRLSLTEEQKEKYRESCRKHKSEHPYVLTEDQKKRHSETTRLWNHKNKDRLRPKRSETTKRWQKNNILHVTAYRDTWYKKNGDRMRAKAIERYHKNAEKIKEQGRIYRTSHREYIIAKRRESWKLTHHDKKTVPTKLKRIRQKKLTINPWQIMAAANIIGTYANPNKSN